MIGFKLNFKMLLFFFIAATVFLFCSQPQQLIDQTFFYIFQGRDMARAFEILSGKAVFFGPEMTGGGYLPGPLYYIFIGIGLFFKSNWIGAWMVQYILAGIAALAGAYFFKSRYSNLTALLWIALFCLAKFTGFYFSLFLNVSCMLAFAVGAIVTTNLAYTLEDEKKRKFNFYLSCLIIGLGLQFHFSIITQMIAMLAIQLFAPKLGSSRLPAKTIALGLILFLIPSIPYIVWINAQSFGIHFGVKGFYNGETDQSLNSIIHLIKIGFADSWSTILTSWFAKFFYSVPLPLLVLLLAAPRKDVFFKTVSSRIFLFGLFFAFIPYLNWYLSPQAMRYSMLFYLGITLYFLSIYHELIKNNLLVKRFNWLSAFVIVCIVGYFGSKNSYVNLTRFTIYTLSTTAVLCLALFLLEWKSKVITRQIAVSFMFILLLICAQKHYFTHSIGSDGYMPTSGDWKYTWNVIHSYSGWTYADSKEKIYYIGHHVNQDPELFLKGYDLRRDPQQEQIKPDGFFVSNRFRRMRRMEFRRARPLDWLLNQNLHPDIVKGLNSGDIRLGKNLSRMNLIVPFWINKEVQMPQHFHNMGEGYKLSSEDLELQTVQEQEGAIKLSTGHILFKWNESSDQDKYCSTGAKVLLKKESKTKYSIDVRIVGGTLSQISPWVSPNWTQAWINPYLEITCGKEKKRFELAESIGFRRLYSHSTWTPFFSGNNSLVAPATRSFTFDCKQTVNNITIGRASSEIEKITSVGTLPGKSLSFDFGDSAI